MDIKDFDVDDLKTAITEALNSPYDIEDAIIVVKIREEYKEKSNLNEFYNKVLNSLKNTYNMEKKFRVKVLINCYVTAEIQAKDKDEAWEKVAEEVTADAMGFNRKGIIIDTGDLDDNAIEICVEDTIDDEYFSVEEVTENE